MTLPISPRRNDYTGAGSTATFSYTFKIFDDDDIEVVVLEVATGIETELVKTTDYTVSSVGVAGGGNIVLVNASQAWLTGSGYLATGYKLVILGARPYSQEMSIRNQGGYYPDVIEDEADKEVVLFQQLKEMISRSLRWARTNTATDIELPATLQADSVLMLNTGMTAFEWLTRAALVGQTGATGATGAVGAVGATGATGAAGATWYFGSGAPAGGLGANGDFYLDTATADVYNKAAGNWSVAGNIKGATGATGAAGSNGSNGTNGTNGTNGANGVAKKDLAIAGVFAAGDTTYTLTQTPIAADELVAWLNGVMRTDYSLVGAVVTFTGQDTTGQVADFHYRY